MNYKKTINKKIPALLIVSILFSQLPGFSLEKLSTKEEEKLNELGSTSKPQTSIFGKLEEPIKANISIYEIKPNIINFPQELEKSINRKESDVLKPITLSPKIDSTKNIIDLKEKRKELQKSEEIGLNFIQPSLQLTSEEQTAINEFFSRNEQEQLTNLWKSTIERNKTIQFIVQKLTPANTTQEGNSLLSKSLGAAIFLPFYALQAFTNNSGAYFGSQVGGRVLGSVIEGKMHKNQAQMQLSQTEAIILFMMIDEVAERLRLRYHAYKKLMTERALITNELEETKQDSLDAQDSKVPEAEVLASIERRSVEREIRRIDAEMRAQKNALIELAGMEAVNDLDNQLKLELAATTNTPLDLFGVGK